VNELKYTVPSGAAARMLAPAFVSVVVPALVVAPLG